MALGVRSSVRGGAAGLEMRCRPAMSLRGTATRTRSQDAESCAGGGRLAPALRGAALLVLRTGSCLIPYFVRFAAKVCVAHHARMSWAWSKLVIGEIVWTALPGSGDCQGTSGPEIWRR